MARDHRLAYVGDEYDVFDGSRFGEKAAGGQLDTDHGVRARELRLLAQTVERALACQIPRQREGGHFADPSAVGGPAVALPAVLYNRRAHNLRDRPQTRGLRDRVLLGAQIAAEDRRRRRSHRLQTLFGSKRDPSALDAVKINRGRLTLGFAGRYR